MITARPIMSESSSTSSCSLSSKASKLSVFIEARGDPRVSLPAGPAAQCDRESIPQYPTVNHPVEPTQGVKTMVEDILR